MTDKQSVVIIGGGPAGLTAAWELIKDGGADKYDVTVLEGTREFGGISRTVKHNGNRMDIGGHRFFSKDERIMDWWKTVLPLQGAPSYDDKKLGRDHDMEPGGPDPETEDKVMLKRHRVSRIFWNRHFFDYPISLSPNTLKAMGFKLTMVAGFSYRKTIWRTSTSTVSAASCIRCSSRATRRSCGAATPPRSPPTGAPSASRACPSWACSRTPSRSCCPRSAPTRRSRPR